MNKTSSVALGAILIIAIGGLVYSQKVSETSSPAKVTTPVQNTSESASQQDTSIVATSTAQVVASGISSADVAKHNSRASCWSTINGNVYDLTSWIPQHPGGEEAILKICGVDGSDKFNGKHGGSPKQASVLFGFKIGAAIK